MSRSINGILFDPDLITLLGQGAVDIGNGDGTSVIPAVSQGIPVVYTTTIYGQFPSIVVARAGSGITTAADLRGEEDRDPRQVRFLVDHAPGPAPVRRYDAR